MKTSKKTIRNTLSAILLSMALNFVAQNSCNNVQCVDFSSSNEDVINLDNYFKTIEQVRQENERFETCIKYDIGNGLQPIFNRAEEVKICAVAKLFNDVSDDFANTNISGLEIHFGLDGNKIYFIYQPVYMKNPTWAGHGKYRYPVANRGKYYTYDTSIEEFSATTADALRASTLIDNYKKYIRIIQVGSSGTPIPINEDEGKWYQDTKSVIYSFQEIFELIDGIYLCGADPGNKYPGSLYFNNGVMPYHYSRFGDTKNKHTIFIASRTLEFLNNNEKDIENVSDYVLGWDAANVAHLCPPSCSPYYKIRRFGTASGNSPVKLKKASTK